MEKDRTHFVGIAGTGMSALAQYLSLLGQGVSGSDRAFDQCQSPEERARLEARAIAIHPQDGSGVPGASRLIASTAVESEIPDLIRARELGIPVLHRSELLAELVQEGTSVAIAGVSGKSTVTAMVFEILRHVGRDPGLITGGDLIALKSEGVRGNAWFGRGPLVVEADESDGTLVRYHPKVGVILNLHLDHMGLEGLLAQFVDFRRNCREAVCVSDQPELAPLREGALVFGWGPDARLRARNFAPTPRGCRFEVGETTVQLPLPGLHNASNALAAMAAVLRLDVSVADAARALAQYRGVARRFEWIGEAAGCRIYDDYAHNPDKIVAAITAAKDLGRRVLALFRPHGFAPATQMRGPLAERLPKLLSAADRFDLLPIYFAGGTVRRSISSEDIAADLAAAGVASKVLSRQDLAAHYRGLAGAGDVILIMGARDPELGALARELLASLVDDRPANSAAAE